MAELFPDVPLLDVRDLETHFFTDGVWSAPSMA